MSVKQLFPAKPSPYWCRVGVWLIVLMMCRGVRSAEIAPAISQILPFEGAAGSIVTIDGNSFAPIPSGNQVFFGGVAAQIVSGSTTQLIVRVPVAAGNGPMTVQSGGRMISSRTAFRQTFPAVRDPDGSAWATGFQFSFATGVGPVAMAAGDLDGDGYPELVVAGFYRDTVTVFPNQGTTKGWGNSMFGSPLEWNVGSFPKQVMLQDLDVDGFPDLLVMNRGSASMSLFRNAGSGAPLGAGSLVLQTNLSTADLPHAFAVADLDADGRPDLAVAVQGGIRLFFNRSVVGNLAFVEGLRISAPVEEPASITLTDLDGDGYADLICSGLSGSQLGVWRNRSFPGTFSFEFQTALDFPLAGSIVTPDLNRDGRPDLCLALNNGGGVVSLRNSSTPGAISAGTLDNAVTSLFPDPTPLLWSGDFNGDGQPDLLTLDPSANRIRWLVNGLDTERLTPRLFETVIERPLPFHPSGGAIADFDADGVPDIALCGLDSDQLLVLRNSIARLNQITVTRGGSSGGGNSTSGREVVEASVFWGGANVVSVDFLVNEQVVSSSTSSPYQMVWTPPMGAYELVVVAREASGGIMRSEPIRGFNRIANDAFQARALLDGVSVVVRGNSSEASGEDSEPLHAGQPGGRSLWWTWVCPNTGICRMSTDGSSFDTLLAVYRGETLKSLQPVASSDDHDGEWTSALSFVAEKGVAYQIALDGNAGSQGPFQLILSLEVAPAEMANDRFENRFVLPSTVEKLRVTTSYATRQPTDPIAVPGQSGRSLWWTWRSATSGRKVITTLNGDFDHVVSVYKGSSVDALQPVATGTGFRCCGGARFNFDAVAGEEYSLMVDGLNGDSGTLSLSIRDSIPPDNDRFDRRAQLSGFPVSDSGSNEDATADLREPILTPAQSGRSLWWEWRAPLSGTVLMSTEGTSFPHMMGVLQGAALTNLSVIASNLGPYCCIPGKLSFEAVQGRSYLLFLDGLQGAAGNFSLSLSPMVRPSNDAFANRIEVRGTNLVLRGSNVGATRESGEPEHHSDGAGKSIWWTWVPPRDGAVSISTLGSSFECAVAVYTGSDLRSLDVVGRYTGLHLKNQTFDVVAGTSYHLVIDGIGDSEGDAVLTLAAGSRPANDQFANRQRISGASAQASGRNVNASIESREPNRSGFAVGNSVWWTWTSGSSDVVVFSTAGTEFDHVISVYTGNSLANLNPMGTAIGLQCCGPAKVVVDNNPNTTYQICISGLGEEAGDISLAVDSVPRPPADLYIIRPQLSGLTAFWQGVNINASKRYDEPNHGGNPGGRSLWWRWTAPATGTLNLTLTNSDFQSIIAVYVGSALETLNPVASRIADEGANINTLQCNVIGGTEYQIAVDGVNGQEGHVFLSLQMVPGSYTFSGPPGRGLWVPDGPVLSMVETNGTLFLGGRFNMLRPQRGSGVAIDVDFQETDESFPTISGTLQTAISDGSGGFYIGGLFDAVGGVPRSNLAHILADRTVDLSWAPDVRGEVSALGILGNLLFVGGKFTSIDQQPVSYLAAYDLLGGAVLQWNPQPDHPVNRLLVYGGALYVAGEFSQILGQPRHYLAQVDLSSFGLTTWKPDPDGAVRAMVAAGDLVYLGGDFLTINQTSRGGLAAFSVRDSQLTAWNASPDCSVSAMAATSDTLFVAGCFGSVDGAPRYGLAAFQTATGQLLPWSPQINGPVVAIATGNRTVYLGGEFTQLNGQSAGPVGLVDQVLGKNITLAGTISGTPSCFARSGRLLLAGGVTLAQPGIVRRSLAAIDLVTGRPTSWDPQIQGEVRKLLLSGNSLYAAGDFRSVGNVPRSNLAKFDLRSLNLSSWVPSLDGEVDAAAISELRLVTVGKFRTVNGVKRSGWAVWNLPGEVLETGWDLITDGSVADVDLQGGVIYLGGSFSSVGGLGHRGVASVDARTGEVLPWDPGLDGDVQDLLVTPSAIWVAGSFRQVRGASTPYLAGLSPSTAAVVAKPSLALAGQNDSLASVFGLAGPVHRLALAGGGRVMAAGLWRFDTGETGEGLALLDLQTAAPIGWAGRFDRPVSSIVANGRVICAGGYFQYAEGGFSPWWVSFPALGAPTFTKVSDDQRLLRGDTLFLSAVIDGQEPMQLQWSVNGVAIPGATNTSLSISNASNAQNGQYTLLAANAMGRALTRDIDVLVAVSPSFLKQPRSQTVVQGSTALFTVEVDASPRPSFQWLCNGLQIPGAVRPSLTLTDVQPEQGGRYSVVVQGNGVSLESDPATLVVAAPSLGLSNNYADRRTTNSFSGIGRGNTTGATREPGEPLHAGKRGGASVWFSWIAPASGTAVFSTRGSAFDTLLGIYTNGFPIAGVGGLASVASDDDHGGFLTSLVSFEAREGIRYDIGVDGVGGGSGSVVLSWQLTVAENSNPRIAVQPTSQVGGIGTDVGFEIVAVSSSPMRYQWYQNGVPVPDSDTPHLVIPRASLSAVGRYYAVVKNVLGESQTRTVDLVLVEGTAEGGKGPAAADKFSDLLDGVPLPADVSGPEYLRLGRPIYFDTLDATKEIDEPNHCGVSGGASKWIPFKVAQAGDVVISTEGSSFNTTLAVYTLNGPSLKNLVPVACDTDNGEDRQTSLLSFWAEAGVTYYIAVDGVDGATGLVRLSAIPKPVLTLPTMVANQYSKLRLWGVPNTAYLVEQSSDLVVWEALVTTNAVRESVLLRDASAAQNPQRFYRATPVSQ